jgi:hypothetical protein
MAVEKNFSNVDKFSVGDFIQNLLNFFYFFSTNFLKPINNFSQNFYNKSLQ